MRTEAAVLWNLNDKWRVQEVDLGDPVEGEVRVRLAATGICRSDQHVATGDIPQALPLVGGHEGAGIVEAVGPGVQGLEVGDPVVLVYIPVCGQCESCAKGRSNLCDRSALRREGRAVSDGTFRFSLNGQGLAPMCLLGTFARHTVVHESQVIKLPGDVPLVEAALIGCSITAGFGAAVNTAEIKAGDIVAVIGIGGLGAAAIQGARVAGARYIVAVDPVAKKRVLAPNFGATHAVASCGEAEELIRELSWGRMADSSILTTDLAYGESLRPAMDLVGKNGRTVVVAVAPAAQRTADISLADVTFYEKQVRGSLYGSASPRAAIIREVDLYRAGMISIENMITTRYRLEDINRAFDDLDSGQNIRGVVVYDDF